MLGFKCKQAVMQRSHARGHSARPPAAAAQLICRRRSRQQLGACADEPHTNRKISRRPFSRCGAGWPTLKTKPTSSPRAAGWGWCAAQLARRARPRRRGRSASWAAHNQQAPAQGELLLLVYYGGAFVALKEGGVSCAAVLLVRLAPPYPASTRVGGGPKTKRDRQTDR